MLPRRRILETAGLLATAAFLLSLGVNLPASAQTVLADVGVIGIDSLATRCPALLYRPMDDLSVRPGGDAQGLGGAYIARAQGVVAVGWEPAGLASLRGGEVVIDGFTASSSSSVSQFPQNLVIPGFQPLQATSYSTEAAGETRAGFLGAGTPLLESGGMRLVGAVSWRRFVEVVFPEQTVTDLIFSREERTYPVTASVNLSERGAIQSFAPSIALQPHPGLSVGANFNFLDGRTHASSLTRIAYGGPTIDAIFDLTQRYTGFVPDFGVRFEPLSGRLQLAGKYTPGYSLKVRGGGLRFSSLTFQGETQTIYSGRLADHDLFIPSSYGLGMAFRLNDRFSISGDMDHHDWSKTQLTYKEPIAGGASVQTLPLEPVTSIQVGAEYVLLRRSWGDLPIRVGFHSAPMAFREMSPADYEVLRDSIGVDPSVTPGRVLWDTTGVRHTGVYHGDQVKGNSYDLGFSVRTHGVSYDVGFEILRYSSDRWYLGLPWDAVVNPRLAMIRVDRTERRLRISGTYRFF